MNDAADLLIVDPHAISRCGLVTCLHALDEVGAVAEASSTDEARAHPALRTAALVIVDHELAGADAFIREVRATTDARVLASTSGAGDGVLLDALRAGAVGLIGKAALTREALAASVRAALNGAGGVEPELLATVPSPRPPTRAVCEGLI